MSGSRYEAELPGGGRALFTGQAEGNMSSTTGRDAAHGGERRDALRLQVGAGGLARGFQVHGTRVRRVSGRVEDPPGNEGLEEADGQATAIRGLAVLVLAADCLPVVLGGEGVVAALHAGWRGLGAGVLEEGVAAIRELGGGGEIAAVLGPCAGVCCYEVGPEVLEALGEPGDEHAKVDLRGIARRRLEAAGVGEIAELGGCTICDERHFSHRREGARAGRQAGIAWLS